MKTIIEAAVEPQREDAVAAAVERMTDRINVELAKLAAVDGDLNKLYERPSSRIHDRNEYRKLAALRGFIYSITEKPRARLDYLPSGPDYRVPDGRRFEAVIARTAQQASLAFDAYVAKLSAKIGECVAAEVEGWLWQHSILTVTRADGSVERWKTQCIINVSVLGKLFNQWPTRKVA